MKHAATTLSLCAILAVGCDREKREFRADADMASTPASVQMTELVPGLPPATQPGVADSSPVDPLSFERNAFHLNEGQRLFEQYNCANCHAAGGGGDIGPTLTDDRWIYGREPQQIYQTLLQGRPNGMPAYGPRLSQTQMWQLTAYVRSLGGFVPKTIAPARVDHMQSSPPPNSAKPPASVHSSQPASAVTGEGSR